VLGGCAAQEPRRRQEDWGGAGRGSKRRQEAVGVDLQLRLSHPAHELDHVGDHRAGGPPQERHRGEQGGTPRRDPDDLVAQQGRFEVHGGAGAEVLGDVAFLGAERVHHHRLDESVALFQTLL
jgi:hypothetical protein